MYKGPNTLVNSAAVGAQPGKNTVTVDVAVPGNYLYRRLTKHKTQFLYRNIPLF